MVYAAGNREKLVVQRRRYACVYKRIAETNATFHGKGGMTERMTDFFALKKSEWSIVHSDVVGVTGLEPTAPRPPVWCATNCATPRKILARLSGFEPPA